MLSLRWLTLGLIVLALIFTLSLGMTPVPTAPSTHQSVALQWVDETTCQQCHLDQVKEWQGSHHQLAMLQPDTTSVRGPFKRHTISNRRRIFSILQRGRALFCRDAKAKRDQDGLPGGLYIWLGAVTAVFN